MISFRGPIDRYSHFVSYHSYLVLLLVLVVTSAAIIGSSMVGTKNMENRDVIPEELEVIQAFELLEDSFGTDDSLMIAIEIDPEYQGSDEVRDVRDPRVIRYFNLLATAAETNDNVESAQSAASVLRVLNGGILPQSKREIIKLSNNNPLLGRFISSDYTMALVRIGLVDVENLDDAITIIDEIQDIIDEIPRPPGLIVNVAGENAEGPIVTKLVGPDIERTMTASFVGIIIVSFLVFASIRYGISPIAVIIIGIIWAMGYLGFIGLDLSPQTSGTISMIMGIGIDFGIQITMRFRDEIKKFAPEKAMEVTMSNVFVPMATTTLAALIGFRAMSMGQLTIFGEFGDIMSLGITACFLAAITIVPVILVLGDKIFKKIHRVFGGPLKTAKSVFKFSRG